MLQITLLISFLCGTLVLPVSAGQCPSILCGIRDPDDCPVDETLKWDICKNRPANGAQWACEDSSISFPTVDCLLADMKTCGNVGVNQVFYSFGTRTFQARQGLRDKLNPVGVMFNDALEDAYFENVLTRFQLDDTQRQQVFVARYSTALAQAATGSQAYIVVARYNGDGGGAGAYQLPTDQTKPNQWRMYEFPTLQRNTNIQRVITVDVSANYAQTVDWSRGDQNQILPQSPAASMPVPDPERQSIKERRDNGSVCSTTSSTALPSCTMRDQDPDQGITSAYCLCEGSKTLPLLSAPSTVEATASCQYTTIPSNITTISPTTSLGPITTNSALCQVCTPVVNNEDSCTTMPNCSPLKATATVEAGNSAVHVGTLTGTALYTSISSALETLCPSVTQTTGWTACKTDTVTIENIPYIESDSLIPNGQLAVSVQAANYTTKLLRDAMINAAALTAQNSASGKNCYTANYQVGPTRRHERRRGLVHARDDFHATPAHMMLCNAVGFAGVQYLTPIGSGATNMGLGAFIDATWAFQVAPGGGAFVCDFIEALEEALAIIAPEFITEEIGIGATIGADCKSAL